MFKEYSFERLSVWQDSKELTMFIYKVTSSFPEAEKFGIISQLRRASTSVCCNLSEGTSRWSNKEKKRFLEIAYGSLMEVLNCSLLSFELGFLDNKGLFEIREHVDKVANKINALNNSFK